jgi:hypothetical protein
LRLLLSFKVNRNSKSGILANRIVSSRSLFAFLLAKKNPLTIDDYWLAGPLLRVCAEVVETSPTDASIDSGDDDDSPRLGPLLLGP